MSRRSLAGYCLVVCLICLWWYTTNWDREKGLLITDHASTATKATVLVQAGNNSIATQNNPNLQKIGVSGATPADTGGKNERIMRISQLFLMSKKSIADIPHPSRLQLYEYIDTVHEELLLKQQENRTLISSQNGETKVKITAFSAATEEEKIYASFYEKVGSIIGSDHLAKFRHDSAAAVRKLFLGFGLQDVTLTVTEKEIDRYRFQIDMGYYTTTFEGQSIPLEYRRLIDISDEP